MKLLFCSRRMTLGLQKLIDDLRLDVRGIAAVEFAFILPVMLTLYLGCVEVTQGVIANRQITAVARTIADLASQQTGSLTDTGNAALGVDVSQIFAASQALLPQATATNPIKMTISSIDFVPAGGGCNPNCVYNAQTSWTVTYNAGTPRPCNVILAPVANGSVATPTNMPVGIYGAGSVIVADVSYSYQPTFGYVLVNNIPIQHTAYMRPRSQQYITFNPVAPAEKCAGMP
jgi:Flp pilus assembly protein TadG